MSAARRSQQVIRQLAELLKSPSSQPGGSRAFSSHCLEKFFSHFLLRMHQKYDGLPV
jgi:hypothetical protein